MSETIIFGFGMNGICTREIYEAHNSWRGAVAVWRAIEKKYLPPYRPPYVPAWIQDDEVEEFLGHETSRLFAPSDPDAMKDVWQIFGNESVPITDRIVLGTTLDNVLVRRENIQKVIEAFESFDKEHEGMTNLKEQAVGLRAFYRDEDITAVGWNQTSVSCDDWSNTGDTIIDEYGDEIGGPYNFNTGERHWWLFDEISKTR